MREKVVLIGAGSAMFTRGLVVDLIGTGREMELALVDTAPEALKVAERLARKMITARDAPITVSAATERRDVLPDATIVICTVGVGGRRAWERDVTVPRQFGIYQPVGDSVMPGGTSRALRMIPPMVAIAEDVLDLAPKALFFNYGNPMAPVCRGIRKATGAPVIGLCHGVFHVAGYLAKELGIPLERLRYTAVGINHLTWFTEVRVDGQDALSRLCDIATAKLAALRERGDPAGLDPFSWHLLLQFGAFPAVLDRHVTEFFPHLFPQGRYYGKTLGVDIYSVEETIARGDAIYAEMREQAFSAEPLPPDYFGRIGGEHEQVVDIIDSIRSDAGRIYSVNLPNKGQIPNLPPDAIVEAPAIADAGGLRPIAQSPLASGLVGTLATRLAWVETIVEAALERSRAKFIQALVLDGAVSSLEQAEALANALFEAQQEHLEDFT